MINANGSYCTGVHRDELQYIYIIIFINVHILILHYRILIITPHHYHTFQFPVIVLFIH